MKTAGQLRYHGGVETAERGITLFACRLHGNGCQCVIKILHIQGPPA
jgi:hypothetical protein